MISTRILKPAAPSDGRNNCVATTRRSANAWNGIVRFFSAFAQSPTTPATSARGGSVRCRRCGYRGTDYSVPTRFGHCEVLVRGYVHEVVISCAAEVIARHPRSYEQEDFVFDPLHYLSLLEQKTNALDQAAPLAGWLLPPVFGDLRRLLEARMGKAGKREYVQVLRLIESFSLDDVRAAISEALERGVLGFDAVKHLVLCRIEKRPPRLNLLAHPYLPRAEVATTSARSYMGLLKGAAP